MNEYHLTDDEKTLIVNNIRLAYWKAHQWAKIVGNNDLIDDFISCCELGLIKAAHTADMTKDNKFATYANACMDNQVKLFLRKNLKNDIPFSSMTENKKDPDNEQDIEQRVNISVVQGDIAQHIDVERLLKKLCDRDYCIIYLYYFVGFNDYEIADLLHLSQSYISRLRRRALQKLKKIINNHQDN